MRAFRFASGAPVVLVWLLSACVPEASQPVAEDSCGAGALQGLIGQGAGVLDGRQFTGPVRVVRPGMAMTMDYNPARLNVQVDDKNLIERAFCG